MTRAVTSAVTRAVTSAVSSAAAIRAVRSLFSAASRTAHHTASYHESTQNVAKTTKPSLADNIVKSNASVSRLKSVMWERSCQTRCFRGFSWCSLVPADLKLRIICIQYSVMYNKYDQRRHWTINWNYWILLYARKDDLEVREVCILSSKLSSLGSNPDSGPAMNCYSGFSIFHRLGDSSMCVSSLGWTLSWASHLLVLFVDVKDPVVSFIKSRRAITGIMNKLQIPALITAWKAMANHLG